MPVFKSILYEYPCDNNVSCYPIELNLHFGVWKIELWGAGSNSGGGYTSGIIPITSTLKLFAYLGGQESPSGDLSGTGGFNGGGNSTQIGYNSYGTYRTAGGNGATDIRLEREDLDSRIMVAGGAGGGSVCKFNGQNYIGGYGGGLKGGDGSVTNNNDATIGYGGEQSSGGKGASQGKKGIGGSSSFTTGGSTDCAGSGGGGYYGGGAGGSRDYGAAGGGGSSYISGFDGCSIHKSKHAFTNAIMKAGNELMPQPKSEINKVGYIGQGAMRITLILPKITFMKCLYSRNSITILLVIILIKT